MGRASREKKRRSAPATDVDVKITTAITALAHAELQLGIALALAQSLLISGTPPPEEELRGLVTAWTLTRRNLVRAFAELKD